VHETLDVDEREVSLAQDLIFSALNLLKDFKPMDRSFTRRGDAESHAFAAHGKNLENHFITNDKFFSDPT
jgi:hypothetical protein